MIVVAALVGYVAYSVYTPSMIEVSKIDASSQNPFVLHVTLHNPTYKFLTGKLLRVETEFDIPDGRGGTKILASVPREYDFTLLPQSSQEIDVPMNGRIQPKVDYDFIMVVPGAGQQVVTIYLQELLS